MPQDISEKIRDYYPSFSKGQKKISNAIIKEYDKVAYMTAAKLGRFVGVSESTVVRFANELGYDGYASFQKAVQELVRAKLTPNQRIEITKRRLGQGDILENVADADIAKILLNNYKKKGINFCLKCKVTAVNADGVSYEDENGKPVTVKADKVLCSIGRRAVTTGYGLENLNVYMERGAVKTDEYMKTSIAGLYAAGDINGVSMLAHTAYREGEVAINNILGKKDRMRYNAIPSVIYTNPEVGAVGETEASAKAKGYDVEVVKLTMNFSGRYVAENEGGDGIVKVIVDKKYNRILGVHMIANYASEIIYGAAMMVETEMTVDNLKEIVFPHPTVCEVIREALFEVK